MIKGEFGVVVMGAEDGWTASMDTGHWRCSAGQRSDKCPIALEQGSLVDASS